MGVIGGRWGASDSEILLSLPIEAFVTGSIALADARLANC